MRLDGADFAVGGGNPATPAAASGAVLSGDMALTPFFIARVFVVWALRSLVRFAFVSRALPLAGSTLSFSVGVAVP